MKKQMKPLALLCVLAALTSCGGTPDKKLVFDPNRDVTDFGDVTMTRPTQRDLIVKNTGAKSVFLNRIQLQNATSFAILLSGGEGEEGAEGKCRVGMELAKNAACTVTVKFDPTDNTQFTNSLKVFYSREATITEADLNRSDSPAKLLSMTVTGRGILNCGTEASLTAAYETGVSSAQAQIATDVAMARMEGEALTEQQGYDIGYADAYSSFYTQGFDSANGYPAGYQLGFSNGYAVGTTDTYACGAGDGDADRDAQVAAYNDAEIAGLADGHNEGYSDGQIIGYRSGSMAGIAVCLSADKTRSQTMIVRKITITDGHRGQCEERGYADTYSRDEADAAYADAVANNTDYQTGLRNGAQAGQVEGFNVGQIDGYASGLAAGDVDGEKAGRDELYAACYASTYPVAYTSYYESPTGYAYYFDQGYEAGEADGIDAGYALGYDDAIAACSGTPGSGEAPLIRSKSLTNLLSSRTEVRAEAGLPSLVSESPDSQVLVNVSTTRLSRVPLAIREVISVEEYNRVGARLTTIRDLLRTANLERMRISKRAQ